jgi:copper(I)-binding protein
VTSRRFNSSARLVAASVLIAGVAVLSACSAGKITQTSTQVAAVPGASVDLGPLALRDLTVAYNGIDGYAKGEDVPLVVRIFNNGTAPVKLTQATTDKAEQIVPVGGPSQPPTTTAPPPASASASPSASASGSASPRPTGSASPSRSASPSPSAAAPAGPATLSIVIPPGGYVLLVPGQGQYLAMRGLKEPLTPGYTTNVTFTFDNGASTTVAIPFGLPAEPGPRASAEPGGEGHE